MINYNPGVNQLVITSPFASDSVGRTFRVQVLSFNVAG